MSDRGSDKNTETEVLESLLESLTAVPWRYEFATDRFIYVGKQSESILGIRADEWSNLDSWKKHIHHEDQVDAAEFCAAQIEKREDHVFEYRWLKDKDTVIWVRDHVRIMCDKSDKPIELIGFITDITDSRRYEEFSRSNEKQIADLTNSIPGMVHQYQLFPDGSDRMLYISEQITDVWGFTPEEVLKDISVLWNSIFEEDIEHMRKSVQESAEKLSFWNQSWRIRSKNGKPKWLNGRGIPEKQEDGSIIWNTIVLDVTELKTTEENLKKTESHQRALLDNFPFLVWLKDNEDRFLSVNLPFAESCGQPNAESLKGKTDFDIWPQDLAEKYVRDDREIRGKRISREIEEEIEYKGDRKWFSTYKAPMIDDDGTLFGTIGFSRDITERKKTEEEIQRMQKLESLGTVAGGIAHDFNNLMVGVFGNLELAADELSPDSRVASYLKEAIGAIDSARHLTGQLLTFAKGGTPVMETVDTGDLIREVVDFNLRGSGVRAKYKIADDLMIISADRGQLNQVLANLTINARQAMNNTGNLGVRVHNFSSQNGDSENDDMIEIVFSDEGVGIPDHVLSRIFDPYFTTREQGHGLGLSIVHSIITRHEGSISVESEKGAGTTFTILLPAKRISDSQFRVPKIEHKHVGNLSILLMDDEESICRVCQKSLAKKGHQVVCVLNGDDAVYRYEESLNSGSPFDLLITDLTIPGGRGGQEILEDLKKLNPDVRVIAMSGYSSDPDISGTESRFHASIAKPFRVVDLEQAISKAMSD